MSPPDRRLSAIFCADIVGYSRLMGADETGTLARLEEARAILRDAIEARGGRVFNLAGDGLLAEFPSALAAVQAALTAQDRLAPWSEAQPEERRVRLRIGINLGDVVVSGADLLGHGVNVAARLQEVAVPGGICLSGAVYDQVRGRIGIDVADLGPMPLKNIAEPVHVYAAGADAAAARTEATAPASARASLRAPRGREAASNRLLRRAAGAALVLGVLLAVNLLLLMIGSRTVIWVQWPALALAVVLGLSFLRDRLQDRPASDRRDRAG